MKNHYSSDSSSIDTLNRFYSRMTFRGPKPPIDSNMSGIGMNLSFPKNKYFYFTTKGIYLYDLTSKRADSISFLNEILSDQDNLFIRNPKLGYIVFNKPFQDTLVGIYDIETKKIRRVVYRYSSLDSGGALLYDGKKINSDLPFEIGSDENLNMSLSDNGRFLIIYDKGNISYPPIKKEISIIIFDLVKHVFSEKKLKLPQDEVYQNLENLLVTNDGVLCYVRLYTGGNRVHCQLNYPINWRPDFLIRSTYAG